MRGPLLFSWPLVLAATSLAAEVGEKRTMTLQTFAPTLWGSAASQSQGQATSSPTPSSDPSAPYPTTGQRAAATTTAVPYQLQVPPLDTPWTDQVGLNPWPEHPRPQLRRDDWKNLNGIWTWQSAGAGNTSTPGSFPEGPLANEVLVPFCIESAISGLQDLNTTSMWYETTFSVPTSWGAQNVVLNFEAVDYEHTVYINGQEVSFFRGGYFRHSIDVTQYLSKNGTNELYVD